MKLTVPSVVLLLSTTRFRRQMRSLVQSFHPNSGHDPDLDLEEVGVGHHLLLHLHLVAWERRRLQIVAGYHVPAKK